MNKHQLLLAVILIISIPAFAQDADFFQPDSVKKEIEALRINTFIHVDGLMNEPEWKQAKPAPRFIQVEPYQGKDPSFETDVRVMYNREYLYIGVFSHDSLGKKAIRATDFMRDFDYTRHDLNSISIDGFND